MNHPKHIDPRLDPTRTIRAPLRYSRFTRSIASRRSLCAPACAASGAGRPATGASGTGWAAGAAPPRAAYGGSQVRGEVAFTIESLAGKASACGQPCRGPTIDSTYRNRADA